MRVLQVVCTLAAACFATATVSSGALGGPALGGSSGVGGLTIGNLNQGTSYNTGGLTSGGGSGVGVDAFGSAFGSAGLAAGGFQVGTAQVGIRDRAATRSEDQLQKSQRTYDNADAGAGRQDNQQRRGDLQESQYNKEDNQRQGTQAHEANSFDKTLNRASERGQRQSDVNDKHAIGLENIGRYDNQDIARNSGDKGLAARKNAFARQNQGVENIDYGFQKNFDTNFNERGGFKEAVGTDNTNSDVYEEKQRDNRFSKGELDAFRRSRDNNAFQKASDWTSNAAQKQNTNNQYGAADRLQNAAEQQNVDWNALLDRKNDVFWHSDNAQDKAVRQANDLAQKRADNSKRALAEAGGTKGIQDQKYYGGESFGKGAGGAGGVIGYGTSGNVGVASTGTNPYGGSAGPITGTGVVGTSPVRGRQEGTGGDYVNQYWENARQADLANQNEASQAQSDASASNDYNRGRGVDDSVEVNGQREGKWATDRNGLRDANSQGNNGANADVAKAAELADNALNQRASNSELNAANKNLQAQELDRLNWKRNQVDQDQKIRKQKKFYHDKNEDGFNNEALNYNRNRGNNDWGEEQQAQKEARTRYNNAADDAKANQWARGYNNLDARRISNADAVARSKDDQGAWQTDNVQAQQDATASKAASDNGRRNSEVDDFAQNVNQRNQQLWDQARQDLAQRSQGSDKERSVDAAFRFTPETSNDALGLGVGRTTAFGQGRETGIGGTGSGFGSEVGSFMGPIGNSKFGQTAFGGSGVGTQFGQTAFGGSAGGSQYGSGDLYSTGGIGSGSQYGSVGSKY